MSFTVANAAFHGAHGGRNSKGKPKQTPRAQVKRLQAVALADATNPETPTALKAALMRAYVDLQELGMALDGIGKPRPVIARNDAQSPRKRRPAVSPVRVAPVSDAPKPPTEPTP